MTSTTDLTGITKQAEAACEGIPGVTSTVCPPWCTLRPGHGWDSIHDDGRRSRGHGGVLFGARRPPVGTYQPPRCLIGSVCGGAAASG